MRHVRWQAKRVFGVPEDKAQDQFSDPDGRMTKRAGGASTPATARRRRWTMQHIVVAAALTNNGSAVGRGFADHAWHSSRMAWNSCGCRSLCAASCTAGQMR